LNEKEPLIKKTILLSGITKIDDLSKYGITVRNIESLSDGFDILITKSDSKFNITPKILLALLSGKVILLFIYFY
jgi:hypothetical protein